MKGPGKSYNAYLDYLLFDYYLGLCSIRGTRQQGKIVLERIAHRYSVLILNSSDRADTPSWNLAEGCRERMPGYLLKKKKKKKKNNKNGAHKAPIGVQRSWLLQP